jgi:5-methylcytosine-specific restriction endonuclease McrA
MYTKIYWGGNGGGDRWANKKFNYSAIYSKKRPRKYSENDDDQIPEQLLKEFLAVNKGTGIIGIFVFSKRKNSQNRPIRDDIKNKYKNQSCVVCGSKTDMVCDHKNDLYNDHRVLNTKTQHEEDFQALCNHCNLQKRQICIKEYETQEIYSAKNIQRYKQYDFKFPWEKKVFDIKDINCKRDTYWFDPVEFDNKIYCYLSYTMPIIKEIKYKVKHNKLKLK